ncbi:hypothetical protein ACSS6W_002252 [Trichoderma asperelloides]
MSGAADVSRMMRLAERMLGKPPGGSGDGGGGGGGRGGRGNGNISPSHENSQLTTTTTGRIGGCGGGGGSGRGVTINAPTKTHDATSPDGRTKCRKQKGRGQQTADNLTTDSTTTETEDPRLTLSHRLASWPIQPSLEPFTDNVTFSYFFDAYSWINVHSILLQDTPMRQHLAQQSDELCYDSLRALTYGIFSRDHQVDGLKRTARRIYGKVLQQLQSKLGTASKSELASLIKPISIMGSYAITVESDLRFVHHQGLARILEFCGAEYFQDSKILPVFESCRFTIIANALVQRKNTLISEERWKSVPWALRPDVKTHTSKLLDIISDFPGVIQKMDKILNERSQWTAGDTSIIREETPNSIPNLQQQLESIYLDLLAWRYHWFHDNYPAAQDIVDWALFRVSDESHRPGIYTPDVYGLNMGTAASLDVPFGLNASTNKEPEANAKTFALMQEATLYLTGLIWVGRMRKNLAGAARASDAIDFYNASFFSTCRCYYDNLGPSRQLCQVYPEPKENMETAASWNIYTAKISESPIRSLSYDDSEASPTTTIHNSYPNPLAISNGMMLIPGDGRFVGQLRILNWLVKQLPNSRAYVLGTLAAMGLSHCVHDVRPSEGNEDIAEAIRETMKKTRYGDAADVLLKRYR